jgi:predicted O-methyltransferase YrrM
MKRTIKALSRPILLVGIPFTWLSSIWLKFVMKAGPGKINDKIFMRTGILPVPDHYYQPLINPRKHLTRSLRDDRELPGIDMNTAGQLALLSKFDFTDELVKFPVEKKGEIAFYYKNGSYESGDAEYLYNIIRYFKPKALIEIGSGYSTLMARNAIDKNKVDPAYTCRHICIEPYEQPWLEKTGITLIREKVENIDKNLFKELEENDILFIDSSHIIRPQGDVLFEYLELLPLLKPGVIIHVHDIFTPKDYPDEWIYGHKLWNEQYLLEAFLTLNTEFTIIGALNYLSHNHRNELAGKCPIFALEPGREPGSFWMIRK